jgi:hypothetical protein
VPTGQVIVNGALTDLGILEQGGTPSVSDSVDALGELNGMWEQWGVDENFIYAVLAKRFPTAASVGNYTIGVGGQFNMPRPGRIYEARFLTALGAGIATSSLGDGGLGYAASDTGLIPNSLGISATYLVNTVSASGAVLTYSVSVAGTGFQVANGWATQTGGAQPGVGIGFTVNILTLSSPGVQTRTRLAVVSASEYYAHNDLSAVSGTPDELYPDFAPDVDGFSRIYLYPMPLLAAALEIEVGVPFAAWTLTANYNVPQGFGEALQHSLAWHLLPRYGLAVAQQVAEVVRELGQRAEATIVQMIAANRQRPPVPLAAPAPGAPAGGPITTPGMASFQGLQPRG